MTTEHPARPSCPYARDNWRRVRELWIWLGRSEENDRLLRLLARYAPEVPIHVLSRAQQGHPRGGGKLRRCSARALVGPLLGVRFEARAGEQSQLGGYDGPGRPDLVARLRLLSPHQHLDLAEHWVDYLRRERDDLPSALPPSAASELVEVATSAGSSAPPIAASDSGTQLVRQLMGLTHATRALLDAYLEKHPTITATLR